MICIDKRYSDNDPTMILVVPAEDVPALSFAKLSSYNSTNQYFTITKPDINNLSIDKVVIVPYAIPNGKKGIAYIDGIHPIQKDSISSYTSVGTKANSWQAKEGTTFNVVENLDSIAIIRPIDGDCGVRKAYCKSAAGFSSTITCYLDTNITGEEIIVNCSIMNGTALSEAIPRLAIGSLIFIAKIGSDWYCVSLFQRINPNQLQVHLTNGLQTLLNECLP